MRLILYTKQPVLVAGLTAALENRDIRLQTVVDTVEDLADAIEGHQPDVVLIDLDPRITFDSLTSLKRKDGNFKIILWVEEISTEFAYQAMGLGVRGILRKSLPVDLIAKCCEKVQAGELWFEKSITDSFIQARRVAVTQREGQLIVLLTHGLKNKEIAHALGISEGTVKVYLSRLFQKLGVKDRFELALYGLHNLTTGHGTALTQHSPIGETSMSAPLFGLRSIVLPKGEKPAA